MGTPPAAQVTGLNQQTWSDSIDQVSADVRQAFSGLSLAQLNWKPSPRVWSIAQCLHHLLVTNRSYGPKFTQLMEGRGPAKFWTALPGWAKLWGRLIYYSVKPGTSRFFPAPTLFRPEAQPLDPAVLQEFLDEQELLKSWLARLEHLDFERSYISSPINPLVMYSLSDAFRILVTHERLHFLQASRVLATNPLRSHVE